MADQICYAVLCVFSYFAAGQEQKKAILEQAARVPSLAPPPQAARSVSDLGPDSAALKNRTSPQLKADRRSPVNRPADPKFAKVPSPTRAEALRRSPEPAASQPDPARTVPSQAEPARSTPSPGEAARSAPSGGEPARSGAGHDAPVRRDSVPPRRPPPPAPAPQRLARAHSQAAPTRPHEPPLLPPRPGARPAGAGPPPALPPRQLSAAADLNTTPSPGSPPMREASTRRLPPRQGSVGGPFAPTNPFTTPRHAEFVIPQRNSIRRPSTDLNK